MTGDKFSIESLLGPLAGLYAERYLNGTLVIARLSPQDYHRYSSNTKVSYYIYIMIQLDIYLSVSSGLSSVFIKHKSVILYIHNDTTRYIPVRHLRIIISIHQTQKCPIIYT